MRAETRGFVRPRLLSVLAGVAGAGFVAASWLPCGGKCGVAEPAPRATLAEPVGPPAPPSVPVAPTPPASLADRVGLYAGADGCTLRVDTLGEAHGCGVRGVSVEGWHPTSTSPSGLRVAPTGPAFVRIVPERSEP